MAHNDASVMPWAVWFAAADRDAVDAALRAVFAAVDEDIAGRNPTCWLSGKCCHFQTYGHRLYVTGLEIAWMLRQVDAGGRAAMDQATLPTMDGCPFQKNQLCGVHAIRPLGCRIYFCDPTAQDWQNDVYERYLNDLRRLHERFDLPYAYIEWRAGLASASGFSKAHPRNASREDVVDGG